MRTFSNAMEFGGFRITPADLQAKWGKTAEWRSLKRSDDLKLCRRRRHHRGDKGPDRCMRLEVRRCSRRKPPSSSQFG